MSPSGPTLPHALAAACLALLALPWPADAGLSRTVPITRLQPIGEGRLPRDLQLDGIPVGGLSAFAYDARRNLFYALSDDRSELGPARFYRLVIDLSSGHLREGDVTVVDCVFLRDPRGETYPIHSLDPEGLALGPDDTLFVSSEGDGDHAAPPFLRQLRLDGSHLAEISLPAAYLPHDDGRAGVRRNLAFESLTADPDRQRLFTAVENALLQDGPAADLAQPSPARLLELAAATGEALRSFLYWTEPAADPPDPPSGFRINGLTELLALGDDRLLALERAYSEGVGNRALLFQLDLRPADELGSPEELDADRHRPVGKQLLADLDDLRIHLENLEGMTFGPRLPDGRESLLLISDDNFTPPQQTQILAFAIERAPLRIADLQGSEHRSPLAESWVADVAGVVTQVSARHDGPTFVWLQELTPSCVTHCGLEVELRSTAEPPAIGAVMLASGWLEERHRRGQLGVTTLRNATLQSAGLSWSLPAAIELLPPATSIDDDGSSSFDPSVDSLDYLESYEGMRVEIDQPLVVGPTSEHGDLVVVAGPPNGPRTSAGGLRIHPAHPHANRLALVGAGPAPAADVGDRFNGSVTGVLSYDYGLYRVLASGALPPLVRPVARVPPRASLEATRGRIRIASYNLKNLSLVDPSERFARLAQDVVDALGAPEILALQEVQDDSGAADDGVVSATRTLAKLTEAIADAGGPLYRPVQLDPVDGGEGGRPGGNIRVAFLLDPAAVRLVERTAGDTEAGFSRTSREGLHLGSSPGRIGDSTPPFAGDPQRGWSGSRRPLAVEVEAHDRRMFLIGVHLSSKSGDDPQFGSRQPPLRPSEAQRTAQAELIAEHVRELLTSDPSAAVVVLGDFNEFEELPPLAALTAAGLTDLALHVPAENRYSFNFQGQSQLLDHVLVSPALLLDAKVEIVHRNSDFAERRRSSDHDPLVASLRLQ